MPKRRNNISKRRIFAAYISSVISISLVLVLIGLGTLLLVNARSVSDYFKENLQLSVLLKQEATDSLGTQVMARLQEKPFTSKASLVSKEQGAAELRQMLGEDFLEVFDSVPVPVSIDLFLKAEYVSTDSLSKVESEIRALPEVEEINSQKGLVEALSVNMSKLSLVLGVIILMLLFISVMLMNNLVRLNMFSRRFSIHTMQLVGAERGFIRRPFIGRAAVQGLLSGVVALAILGGILYFVHSSVPQLLGMLDLEKLAITCAAVLLCGILICVVSTWFVVNRMLSFKDEELYG